MKKFVLMVGGALVLIGAVILINRDRAQGSDEGEAAQSAVSQASRLPGADEGRRNDGDTGQGLQNAGQAGMPDSQLSDAVKALIGLDGEEHDYNSLQAAIGKLSKDLPADEVAALRDMLTWPNDRFPEGMRPIEINAVKNDVLDRLLRQTELPEGLGLQMVEMASNPDNDSVWRDYCIQFMQPFYERYAAESMAHGAGGVPQASSLPSDEQGLQDAGGTDELKAVRNLMVSALSERDGTLAGTSLIGLELLSRTHDEFDRAAIVNSALDIAADESASSSCRLSAMRLSAQISNTEQGISNVEVAESARLIAQTGETVLLRSAAIVTLGEVGTDADRELLESYTTDSNQQIASAAKLALEKMDAPAELVVDLTKPATAGETAVPVSTQKLPPVLMN
jgi:hypothetical protein